MAMAARRERGMLDPDATEGDSPFDHQIYAICSDGDIEEGVSSEASSIAAAQGLGNLTLIYDANQISIEDDTDIALSEDVAHATRPTAGMCRPSTGPTAAATYREDVPALYDALSRRGRSPTGRRSSC